MVHDERLAQLNQTCPLVQQLKLQLGEEEVGGE